MKSKVNALQQALKQGGGKATANDETASGNAPTDQPSPPEAHGRPPSRAGKKNISGWFDPAYERSLLMVRAATGKKGQTLLAEALNDLFAKYDVPQIRED
jgi:hypothetical protein